MESFLTTTRKLSSSEMSGSSTAGAGAGTGAAKRGWRRSGEGVRTSSSDGRCARDLTRIGIAEGDARAIVMGRTLTTTLRIPIYVQPGSDSPGCIGRPGKGRDAEIMRGSRSMDGTVRIKENVSDAEPVG